MEVNKGEAQRCLDLAKKFVAAGQHEKAVKFFNKSLHLYPLPGVERLRDRVVSEHNAEKAKPAARGNEASRRRADVSDKAPTKSYTPEQQALAKDILKLKSDHYKVLGVETSASDSEIKKAYRKLALKLHPDKNTAPQAEDAFKSVSTAFSVLSDPEKKANYDKYGDDEGPQAMRGHGPRGQSPFGEDMTPEDIFNMFFNGAPGPSSGGGGFHYHSRRRTPGPGAHRGDERANNGLMQVMQLLPLLILFALSFFSAPSEEMLFSLNVTTTYRNARQTSTPYVVPGVKYYVKDDFAHHYARSRHSLSKVEQQVQSTYERALHSQCQAQKQQQKRLIYQARNMRGGAERERKLKKAMEFPTPSCDDLSDLNNRRGG